LHIQDIEALANFIVSIQNQMQQLANDNASLKAQLEKIVAAQKELNQGK